MVHKADTRHKLITCVLPIGVAMPLAHTLREEKAIVTTNVSNARGVGMLTATAHLGLGDQTEKQILTVTVDQDVADEIFEFIYFEAKINQPHGGLMYMSRLDDYVPLIVPEDLPEEEL